MFIRLAGPSPFKLVFAGTLVLAAFVANTAHGRLGEASPALDAAFDTVFDATALAFAGPAPEAPPDLNDGRSVISGRWRHSFEAFASSDRTQAPADGGIVFVGSSSISLWSDLPAQFPGHQIVQRGLGGARMSDCLHYADRLILPYRPSTVIVYAGDNDLAEGVSPEAIVAGFDALVEQVHQALPRTRIAFVSVKPSPSRAALLPLTRRTNALMAAYAKRDPRLDYIDVYTPMLDAAGQARADLFRADALHPSAAGYAVWREAIAAHLE